MIAALIIVGAIGAAPPPAVDLRAGDPAPFAGVLIPAEVALKCATCVKVELPTCRSKTKAADALCATKTARLSEEREAERERGDKLAARLAQRAEPPPVVEWYEHPVFWGFVGLAVGVGLALALAL